MTEKERVEVGIRSILATESSAVSLSEKLFSPAGLFSQLAGSDEERQALVRSSLFREAQARFRQLQYQEAEVFSRAVPNVPDGYVVKIEKVGG